MNKQHNRNKLQSLVKDIKKGFSRLYWFSYTFLKYYYFNLKFKLKKKNN